MSAAYDDEIHDAHIPSCAVWVSQDPCDCTPEPGTTAARLEALPATHRETS